MPTLLFVGDFIFVNKYTYGLRLPVINTKIVRYRRIRIAATSSCSNSRPIPVRITLNDLSACRETWSSIKNRRLVHKRGAGRPGGA